MFYIADKPWVDLDAHLDIKTFDSFKDKIELGIANNHQRIVPAVTPKSTFLDSSIDSLYDQRLKYAGVVDPQNLNFYSMPTSILFIVRKRLNFIFNFLFIIFILFFSIF